MEVPTSHSSPVLSKLPPRASRRSRASVLCIPHINHNAAQPHLPSDPDFEAHVEIGFDEEECAITTERLKKARATMRFHDPTTTKLTAEERKALGQEQKLIHDALFSHGEDTEATSAEGIQIMGKKLSIAEDSARDFYPLSDSLEDLKEEEEEAEEPSLNSFSSPPQDPKEDPGSQGRSRDTVKAQLMTAKFKSRLNKKDEGVLGVQGGTRSHQKMNSIFSDKFGMHMLRMTLSSRGIDFDLDELGTDAIAEEDEEEAKVMDVGDISYVRKPNLARIIEEYEAMQNHPKYTLRQVLLSRRFHLYAYRFANAQYKHSLTYPSLPQPRELHPWLNGMTLCGECKEEEEPVTEKQRTRTKGHRFIIAADSQFGILMDGFAMEFPSWKQEIEISRKCVEQINAMHGEKRPLYVCVCGDLVDTESSFSGAIASWKKVMSGWERNLVFEQQVKDFKRVWAGLDPDIALVCLCGNHDVGNRPTRASINHWTSAFGDDYLSFWANGTFNICLNNCLFSNPTGAQDLFEEQLDWMEKQLIYARENDATHIFVYGHFPWFLKHEEESDDFLTSYSKAPPGWGPPGSSFADSYFTVPYEQRKIAMALFKKYDVTACFSGHFHQNVVAQTSWGMPMIVTGPLSMNLASEIAHELSNGETNGIGMRVVDVGERGEFTHKWTLLDGEEQLHKCALKRIGKGMGVDVDDLLKEVIALKSEDSGDLNEDEEIVVSDLEAMKASLHMSGLDMSKAGDSFLVTED